MGTGIKCTVNLFTAIPKQKSALTIGFDNLHIWAFSKNRSLKNSQPGFNQLQGSMDRLFKECNRESLRNIMLKHEETFKEQVRELHRLYGVQKILMAELNEELKIHSPTSATPAAITETRTWPSSHELSICSGEISRMQGGFDLEKPAEEDIARDVVAIDQPPICRGLFLSDNLCMVGQQLYTDGESDIELTLSIGCGMAKNIPRHQPDSKTEFVCSESTLNDTRQILSTPVRPGKEEHGNSSASSSRESLPRPPWPFQALSLNRT